ncbi:Uncharacterized protein FWK35_00027880, partial [Aphis craccivora]
QYSPVIWIGPVWTNFNNLQCLWFYASRLELHFSFHFILTNSERSHECIDFTMLCVFFFQIMGVVSCSKMNLVGALGRSFFEFPNSFQKRREKQKKN